MITEFIIILSSIFLSAFFSGMEIAFVSANKMHIELEKKKDTFLATILTRLTLKPSKYITTMLVGNNVALVIYGIAMSEEILITNDLQTFIPMDRRVALVNGNQLPDRTNGAALFADISGFTPLTRTLLHELGPRRGAEEILRQINPVYDALIDELHRYGGSVIVFAGCLLYTSPSPRD